MKYNANANNAIDITVEPIDNINNHAYLVDKRLVDILLAKTSSASLMDIKADLITVIDNSVNKDDMFKGLDDYIYLNKVINHDSLKQEETVSQ